MTATEVPASVREEDVLTALRAILDPDLHRDIVALGFVKNVRICGEAVALDIELTTPACPVKEKRLIADVSGPSPAPTSRNPATHKDWRSAEPSWNLFRLRRGRGNVCA